MGQVRVSFGGTAARDIPQQERCFSLESSPAPFELVDHPNLPIVIAPSRIEGICLMGHNGCDVGKRRIGM